MKRDVIYIVSIIILLGMLLTCEKKPIVIPPVPIYVTEYIQDTTYYNNIIDSLDTRVDILRTSNESLTERHAYVSKRLKMSISDTIRVKEYIKTTDTLIIIKDSIIYEQGNLIDTQYVYLDIKDKYIEKLDSNSVELTKQNMKLGKKVRNRERLATGTAIGGFILGVILKR